MLVLKTRLLLLHNKILIVFMSMFGILNAASSTDIQKLQSAIKASNATSVAYILKRTTFSPDELRNAYDTAEQVYQYRQQSLLGRLSSKQRAILATVASIGTLGSLGVALKNAYQLGKGVLDSKLLQNSYIKSGLLWRNLARYFENRIRESI